MSQADFAYGSRSVFVELVTARRRLPIYQVYTGGFGRGKAAPAAPECGVSQAASARGRARTARKRRGMECRSGTDCDAIVTGLPAGAITFGQITEMFALFGLRRPR